MEPILPVRDMNNHPCFNKKSSGSCGRAHLPVAPKCNIQCRYCNRKYDCVNESRPGVSSAVLSPAQAVSYMEKVLAKEPRITVAGIAGPGDPMANADETLTTMRLLKDRFPHLIFCMSSNGLALPQYMDDLVEVGVSHMTVTVNAVDPAIGEQIYDFVRDGKVVYRGRQAAELLLERQLEAIRGLKERGLLVKANSIVIPGVNEHHLPEVAKVMGKLGVDLMNMIPLCPTAGTAFAELEEPSRTRVRALRQVAEEHVTQMTHCRRCRADAVGMLCKDRSGELSETLKSCSTLEPMTKPVEKRPYVAVATREGMLVNQHLGEAQRFQIWEATDQGFRMKEDRRAPSPGCGPKRWELLADTLHDCRAVLVAALGDQPRSILQKRGIAPYPCEGFIEAALDAVYSEQSMDALMGRSKGLAGSCCSGGGKGCV